ncbi:ABC transporter substrate-binding protein [Streptomyces nitrosporeus]|uniref:ABC transporter substrate-binding protein n=1 Tax=Streptomyces nitrosporeus TaxID=28894 RepID=A0A5J6FME6_9ACTN|nr:ABC transporter substrate-binding protein [Streptomyces nitrosporeus]QEU76145.1 ABC transporter substrate-binding protein [Streptomyces nitrosporeus]
MHSEPGGRIGRRGVLRATGAGIGVLAVSAILSACSPQRPEGAAAAGRSPAQGTDTPVDTLTLALPSSVSTLDVSRESGILNYVVACLAQESLLSVGPGGKLGPGLAESWKQPDATTYVYTLRRDAEFSDGTPVTTDDVLASVEAARDEASALAYAWADVASVKATGAREITVRLKNPDAAFAWTPTPGTLLISSKAFLTRNKGKVGTPRTLLLGSGPYRVTSFAADDHVALERNDAWWGDRPSVRSLKLSFVPDAGTRLVAMKSGAVDGALGLPSDEARSWETDAQVTYTGDRSVVALAFDTAQAPFDDVHVRRAFAHAADRAGMTRGILHGKADVASTLVSPDMWGDLLSAGEVREAYDALPGWDFDLDLARAELAKSAHKDGFSLDLTYPSSGPQLGKAALALAASLKKIGITLNVEEATLEQWIAGLLPGRKPLQFLWYYPVTGDPAELTNAYLDGGATATNLPHYDSTAVNEALAAARRTTDRAARGEHLMAAVTASAEDLPYLPLWWAQTATALSKDLVFEEPGPFALVGPWATRVKKAAS